MYKFLWITHFQNAFLLVNGPPYIIRVWMRLLRHNISEVCISTLHFDLSGFLDTCLRYISLNQITSS